MIRIFTLISLFLITSFSALSQATYVDNGSNSTYTLAAGDSLSITGGTFTGTINNYVQGAKITVNSNASFKPTGFETFRGVMTIYGMAVLPQLKTLAGFELKNYGKLTVTGATEMNGAGQPWTNYYGGVITFNGSVALNKDNGNLLNQGTITVKGDFSINSVSTFTNKNNFGVEGNFNINRGTVTNGGNFYSAKSIVISQNASFTNTCKTIADNGIDINNNSATVYNSGLLWATSRLGTSWITNNGTIINSPNSKMKSGNFTNYGRLTGSGFLYFTGTTTGSGTIGTNGVTTDTLKVYDVTRTSPPNIFDTQWGTVYPNTIYKVFDAPDTTGFYSNCSLEFVNIPLPVKWNFFYVNLSGNIPTLNWGAEQDPGTQFRVERSYDGVNYTTLTTIAAAADKTTYAYNDATVNTQVKLVYYRIRAIEPTGAEKISETRTVKFSNKTGVTVQTTPNPFTSQFTINYQSNTREALTINIYNLGGQLQVAKTVAVNNGFNTITITEAAVLSRGMYMVQLVADGRIIASEKIIKQ